MWYQEGLALQKSLVWIFGLALPRDSCQHIAAWYESSYTEEDGAIYVSQSFVGLYLLNGILESINCHTSSFASMYRGKCAEELGRRNSLITWKVTCARLPLIPPWRTYQEAIAKPLHFVQGDNP